MMIPWPEESKVNAVFFDKNLDNLESHLPPQTKIIVLKQTHGTEVISINEKNKDLDLEGDALVTTLSNIALTIHTADCLPLLGFEGETLGACHGGWRGVSDGIIESWIAKMKVLGAKPELLKVAIGPSIGPCHFEVGKDVSLKLTQNIPAKFLNHISKLHSDPNKDYIDLKELARFKLLKLGIHAENILISSECTYCVPELFHSFRRDGSAQKGLRLRAVIVKPLR